MMLTAGPATAAESWQIARKKDQLQETRATFMAGRKQANGWRRLPTRAT